MRRLAATVSLAEEKTLSWTHHMMGEHLRKNLRALEAVSHRQARRKWVVYDKEVNDAFGGIWPNGIPKSEMKRKSWGHVAIRGQTRIAPPSHRHKRKVLRGGLPIEDSCLLASVVDYVLGR